MAFLCFLIALNRAQYLAKYAPINWLVFYSFPIFNFQEASAFFKKRATIEDEYGKQMQKLARTTSEVYALNDGKAGYAALHFG